MKKFMLFSSLFMLALSVSAASDITPKRYNFGAMPVGPLTIDHVGAGKIAPADFAKLKNEDGVIQLMQTNFSKPDHADIEKIKSGLSITDLGGQVGKVLCFKGNKSTYDRAAAQASAELAVPNFTLAFYLNPELTPLTRKVYVAGGGGAGDEIGHDKNEWRLKSIIRTTIVFKIVDNLIDPLGDQPTTKVWGKFGNGVGSSTQDISSFAFATVVEDPETLEPTATYNENDWVEISFDHYANEAGALPFWAEMTVNNSKDGKFKLDEKVLLIKSVKMTTGYNLGDEGFYTSVATAGTNPTGFTSQNIPNTLPVMMKKVQFASGPASLNGLENEVGMECAVSGNEVFFNNLSEGAQVSVYSVNGQQVSSFIAEGATKTITLEKGYYLAKAGKKTVKLVVF